MADLPFTKNAAVKMAILEEKLSVYEELSREMLAKLENAVDKISEANQNISKILVRHEERIDQTLQSDAAIIKLLDEMKKQNSEQFKEIDDTLKDHDKKIGDIAKFRWMLAGGLLVIGFILGEMRPMSEVFNFNQSEPQFQRPAAR
jgi:threonyl-tRNA synthetase